MYVQCYYICMNFQWDGNKNQTNIRKNGISFEEAVEIFQSIRFSAVDSRYEYGEERIITVGEIRNQICIVVYTHRNNIIRIISARRANMRERKTHNERVRETREKLG